MSRLAPLFLAAVFLAAMLPTLNSTRLTEVDELTHATISREMADAGRWMPLTLHGKPWPLKPPLMFWVSAFFARISGDSLASWPYRVGTCLAAAACVAALVELGILAGSLPAGIFAGLLFGLQGDLLFHARFFTMDTAVLACLLWALYFVAMARPLGAGLLLALGIWIKSLFVLAFLPPLLFAAWAGRDRLPFKNAAAWILGGVLIGFAAWFAFYYYWFGDEFVRWELGSDLMGRAVAGGVNERSGNNFRFYTWWAGLGAGALIPLALAAPFGLMRSRGVVAAFAMVFPIYWLALLGLIQSQVINYLLPAEAALCLAWSLLLWQAKNKWAWGICLMLALVSWRVLRPENESQAVFNFSGLAALALIWAGEDKPQWGLPGFLTLAAAFAVLIPLFLKGQSYVRNPEDPSREIAETLLQHPARADGETLNLLGENTQATGFYSRYNVKPLASMPASRPVEATLVKTKNGWVFYPPLK